MRGGSPPQPTSDLRPQPHHTTQSAKCFFLRQRAGTPREGYPGPRALLVLGFGHVRSLVGVVAEPHARTARSWWHRTGAERGYAEVRLYGVLGSSHSLGPTPMSV